MAQERGVSRSRRASSGLESTSVSLQVRALGVLAVGPRGLYAQVPATGQTGIQGQTECPSPTAGGIIVRTYIRIPTHGLPSHSARAVCVQASALSVCITCAGHVHTWCIPVPAGHTSQPHCWLDLGTQNSRLLTSHVLLDVFSSNIKYTFSSNHQLND